MQKITAFLWFDDNAEEAIYFYLSVFKNGKILGINRDRETGKLFLATFELEDQQFIALNGGPNHRFTDAISFVVDCATQAEVDELWEKLSEGGEKGQCAWLKDKFGLSWQIVPRILMELINDPDPVKSKRVMDAMLQMTKIDIKAIQRAYQQD
jgi:predicted 3-demethylubiquinone-9 3-methyltransferase (glyoxalase superfamily)